MTTPRRAARDWGKIRKLPSGRYQASYLDDTRTRRTAPATFRTRADADAWLTAQQRRARRGHLARPATPGPQTLGGYAAGWLAGRDLGPRAPGGCTGRHRWPTR